MRLLTLVLLWLTLLAAPAAAQTARPGGEQRTERIAAELVPMTQWATPGSTVIVAVRQKIEPGWHTYWRNPGDSGGPTTIDWSLPAGLQAGAIVWPLPERQRLMTLMNFGYSDEVYLPVPIEVPASVAAGTMLSIRADVLFMVCSDQMCVPDEMTLALDLPVREGEAPVTARHGAIIERVLAQAPRPAGIEARITARDGVLTLSATGGPLADGPVGRAVFFPFEGGVIDHPADQPGATGPQGLSLTLQPGGHTRAAGLSGPVEGVLATDRGAWEIRAEPGEPLAGTTGGATLAADDGAASSTTSLTVLGLIQAGLLALLGGLILNLMPCVFPILAMKAASLAGSAHDPREARRDGLMFLLGVLATFAALAGALIALRAAGEAVGWGFQLQSPAVVAVLALLMLAVGLNLSGVFAMGAGLQNAGQGPLARLPGGAGAFFTGVLAVVVAAPCTAPFMAAALGAALVMPWPAALAVFLMLGLGLALPYVLVSLSPALLRRFPRPGPWMDRLKGLLAFPMYGAALWLVWVFSRQAGPIALAGLFTAGLLVALGLWLWGLSQGAKASGGRGRISGVFAGLALLAAVSATVAAARLPLPEAAGEASSSGPLASQPWSAQAVEAALAEGRPVLVNFTADWCVTCKINEGAALSSGRVARAMTDANAAYLVGDWTRRDDAITRELERHGRSGVPLYLLYRPGRSEPEILPQLLTDGLLVQAITND